jgi:hypothetical protein
MSFKERSPRASRARAARRLVIGLLAMVALGACAASGAQAAKTVWLCKPGQAANPCKASRTATVVTYPGGVRKEALQKSVNSGAPPIDCFYVYPTVSEQEGPNANLTIEPEETQIAIDQASRFSQNCRVFAPMYPQLTLKAIESGPIPQKDLVTAYLGVLSAFEEYMQHFNKGRGFVLIGHSQGSAQLEQLIREQIDPFPSMRKQLVSAILLGGQVLVPEGGVVGATFQNVPLCQSATQTSCVIAYSSFAKEPPEGAFFGRPGSPLLEGGKAIPGTQVACVNPTLLNQDGSTGGLLPYGSTTPFPGKLGLVTPTPKASTPWVESPGLFTAQCKHENGASWLQVSPAAGVSETELKEREAAGEVVGELLGPDWGLHITDVNEALGNLVNTVAIQSAAFRFGG